MADIELVIKIDEEEYKNIKACTSFMPWAEYLIKNGKPLPKGHGKIGDIDRLQEVFRRNVMGADAYKQLFDDAPTIIEADKGER